MKEFTPALEQAKTIAEAYEHCNSNCFECNAKVRTGTYEHPYELKCSYAYERACKVLSENK